MGKPWEETWAAHGSAVQADGWDVLDAWYRGDDPISGHARARLAAAAPDLVRALLAVEYDSAVGYEGELHVCPWCDGMDPAREYVRYDGVTTSAHYGVRVGHAPDCQRQAALRKAGVIK